MNPFEPVTRICPLLLRSITVIGFPVYLLDFYCSFIPYAHCSVECVIVVECSDRVEYSILDLVC